MIRGKHGTLVLSYHGDKFPYPWHLNKYPKHICPNNWLLFHIYCMPNLEERYFKSAALIYIRTCVFKDMVLILDNFLRSKIMSNLSGCHYLYVSENRQHLI